MKDFTTKELIIILIDTAFQLMDKRPIVWSPGYQEQRTNLYNKVGKEIRSRDQIEVMAALRELGEQDETLRKVLLKVLTSHN